jgi:fumarate reductase subunit D
MNRGRRPQRNHPGYWAFVGHRLSGVALAIFLPLHFLMLGLALEGAAALDDMLVLTDQPLVKFAEWGLVTLLSAHLFFGLRLLVLEFLPWRDGSAVRTGWIVWGAGGAFITGLIFLAGVA